MAESSEEIQHMERVKVFAGQMMMDVVETGVHPRCASAAVGKALASIGVIFIGGALGLSANSALSALTGMFERLNAMRDESN